jgi:hypothetical protein
VIFMMWFCFLIPCFSSAAVIDDDVTSTNHLSLSFRFKSQSAVASRT